MTQPTDTPPARRRRAPSRRRRRAAIGAAFALVAGGFFAAAENGAVAKPEVDVFTSSLKHPKTGELFTVTNHLVKDSPEVLAEKQAIADKVLAEGGGTPTSTGQGKFRQEYMVVWAGDANAADQHTGSIANNRSSLNPETIPNDAIDASVGPDFLAVVDATKNSPTYGKVVNTATVGPIVENEPHHMQYSYVKGDKIYAGGLYSDVTYVFDVAALPEIKLSGVNLPTDTPCGSVPDAYWTLKDGTAYGTYMGGPDLPGPCTYTNGEIRVGNGFGGSPGSLVRLGPDGKTLSESPVALREGEDPVRCPNYPALPQPTCANPHGIQVREDLNRLVVSDYAEPRNIVLDPVRPPSANVFRDTVRIFDISERDNPKLVSVSAMPDGPRKERNASHEEGRGIMEVTVTNQKGNKGAFASSMCGGVVYYTPDITNPEPAWREVFDVSTASANANPQTIEGGGCTGAGWVQTDPKDNVLYHAVIGRGPGSTGPKDNGSAKQIYTLDIRKLIAAGTDTKCSIDSPDEILKGGNEADCPTLAGQHVVQDNTSGGPHWGTLDNFEKGKDGFYRPTENIKRIAYSNYFVARTNTDGNHALCMLDVGRRGELTMDEEFVDENQGTPCVQFNRTTWPHGDFGDAKPHSMLFVVPDADLKGK